jgi:hypothetical protein
LGCSQEAGKIPYPHPRYPGSVDLLFEPPTLNLKPGSTATVKAKIMGARYPGPVNIEFIDLPSGLTASKARIPQGEHEVQITITAVKAKIMGERYPKLLHVQAHVLGHPDILLESQGLFVSVILPPTGTRR